MTVNHHLKRLYNTITLEALESKEILFQRLQTMSETDKKQLHGALVSISKCHLPGRPMPRRCQRAHHMWRKGLPAIAIARQLGVSRQMVYYYLKHGRRQRRLDGRQF